MKPVRPGDLTPVEPAPMRISRRTLLLGGAGIAVLSGGGLVAYSGAEAATALIVTRYKLSPRGWHILLVSPGPIRRASSDPRQADASLPRYAQEVHGANLPAQANAPGGGTTLRPLDPDWLAERVLAACQRRHSELVVPRAAGLLAGLIEWFPDWGRLLLASTAAKRQATRQSSSEPVCMEQSTSARRPPQE